MPKHITTDENVPEITVEGDQCTIRFTIPARDMRDGLKPSSTGKMLLAVTSGGWVKVPKGEGLKLMLMGGFDNPNAPAKA